LHPGSGIKIVNINQFKGGKESMGTEDIGIFAVCCRCGQMFKISENGAGLNRKYCGLCDNCKAKIGDVSQKLESLIRKIRELAGSSDQIRKGDYNKAIDKMNTARDDIFGADGSAVDFFGSMINVASAGAGEPYQKLAGFTNKALDAYNKGIEGVVKGIVQDMQDFVKEELGLDADQVDFKKASKNAQEFFDKTGDAKGAAKGFLKDARMGAVVVNAAGFIDDLNDYWEKTDIFANDISDFFLAQKNANDLQKLLDQIDHEIENTNKEIKCLRAELNDHKCSE
jgi:hypothetical protein